MISRKKQQNVTEEPRKSGRLRLRCGIVGTSGRALVARRGDHVVSFESPAISGQALRRVLLSLRPRFTYAELLEALRSEISEQAARDLIVTLRREAALIDGPYPEQSASELLMFDGWSQFARFEEATCRRVALIADDGLHRDLLFFVRALFGQGAASWSLSAVDDPEALADVDAVILSTTGMSPEAFLKAADRLDAARRPWIPIGDDGSLARAGPVFAAAQKSSICGRCFGWRLGASGRRLTFRAGQPGRRLSIAALLGLHQLIRIVGLPPSRAVLAEHVFEVGPGLDVDTFIVAPNPACAACGEPGPGGRQARRVRLKRLTAHYADEDLRDEPAEVAGSRLSVLDGPLNVLSSEPPKAVSEAPSVHVCQVTAALSSRDLEVFRVASVTATGFDPNQARLRALARALERSSLACDGTEGRVLARAEELDGDVLLPSRWGIEGHDEASLAWLWADDLAARRKIAVPAQMVLDPYAPLASEQSLGWRAGTSGVGVGFTRASALGWALLELVEGDAMARLEELRPDRVRTSRTAPLAGSGLVAVAHQLRLEIGIPLVIVHLEDEKSGDLRARGSCAHPSGDCAYRHALLEAIRRLSGPAPARPAWYDAGGEARSLGDVTQGNVYDDVAWLLDKLQGAGRSLCVVDLQRSHMRSDFRHRQWAWDIHCVRALCPELAHPNQDAPEPLRRVEMNRSVPAVTAGTESAWCGKAIAVLGEGALASRVTQRLDSVGATGGRFVDEAPLWGAIDAGYRPDVVVVVAGPQPTRYLTRFNVDARARGLTWAPLVQRGDWYDAGPVTRSKGAGCHTCVRMTLYEDARVPPAWLAAIEKLPDDAGGIAHAGAAIAIERLLDDIERLFAGEPLGLTITRVWPSDRCETRTFSPHRACPVCS